ncbi:MAG TPA: EF-hand domain-containing protein [Sphingomicrobium sp.]
MPLPALILPILALAAPAPAAASTPVIVTGHVWAPFISPMGEPFRPHGAGDDTLADWFRQADRNHDGVLTADEMAADADRFFTMLDADHDGSIDPDELVHYEWEVAPDIQVNSRTRPAPGQPRPMINADETDGDSDRHERQLRKVRAKEEQASLGLGGALQGAARYALLNMPEPVAAADADFNRLVSRDEFRQAALARFELLDTAHQGRLTLAQLEAMLPAPGAKVKRRTDQADSRIGSPLPPRP